MVSRIVYGVGVNDSKTPVTHVVRKGVSHHNWDYTIWVCMLSRCYCENQLSKHPSYVGCEVSPEWLNFSVLQAWLKEQGMEEKYRREFVLDKDILLPENKIYSKTTSAMVPDNINKMLVKCHKTGEQPLGVLKRGGSYCGKCRGLDNRSRILGSYKTPQEAHKAWQLAKAEAIEYQVDLWKDSGKLFREDVAEALIKRSELLKYNAANGIETIRL